MAHLLSEGVSQAALLQPLVPIKLLHALADRVIERPTFARIKIPRKARRYLRGEIKELAEQIQSGMDRDLNAMGGPLTADKAWAAIFDVPDLRLALWMAEVNAYSGVYFAYESFVVRTVKIAGRLERLRGGKNIAHALKEQLGDEVEAVCWQAAAVQKAKMIRDALAHNGRRMTVELSRSPFASQIRVEQDEIVILPDDTNTLFETLKACASLLLRKALQE